MSPLVTHHVFSFDEFHEFGPFGACCLLNDQARGGHGYAYTYEKERGKREEGMLSFGIFL